MTKKPEEKNYYSIGEVERITEVKQHILRYWENEFRLIRPARRTSGHRKYTRADLEQIMEIKDLLHNKKFTVSGAKKYLIEKKRNRKKQAELELGTGHIAMDILQQIKNDIQKILTEL